MPGSLLLTATEHVVVVVVVNGRIIAVPQPIRTASVTPCSILIRIRLLLDQRPAMLYLRRGVVFAHDA
jgi:hypothetical protein